MGIGMKGVITRRHFWLVGREFGWRIGLKVLFTRETVALLTLMAWRAKRGKGKA